MEEINYILQRIEKIFANDASGHDYWHTMRVYKNALKIAGNEKCNERIVALSALLHDVDDVKLFRTENFSNARSILAVERDEFMRQYIDEFMSEWEG